MQCVCCGKEGKGEIEIQRGSKKGVNSHSKVFAWKRRLTEAVPAKLLVMLLVQRGQVDSTQWLGLTFQSKPPWVAAG